MKKLALLALLTATVFLGVMVAHAEEEVLFSFENGLEGWDVPDWAYEKPDHVQKEIKPSDKFASNGTKSLEMMAEFPGGSWTGAIVEIQQFFDWTNYKDLATDIYIPAEAPKGLKAKFILTVGDDWKWVEMSRDFALEPGKWTTVRADLLPGSIDWKRVQVDDNFRKDIRKVDIRVVSNSQPVYSGPIYIDNVRVTKK
ncbi:MAG: hypothetical protein HQL28_03955 [Candidatus Omnitrophica bacterium]|nr:hypothetical protein [Candidatus Omnitrophota bacterium]